MPLTTPQAFDALYEAVKQDTGTATKVAARKGYVRDALTKAFPATATIQLQNTWVVGSMGRGTASRPFNDIDLMAHLHVDDELWRRTYMDNSSDFLYRVRTSLNQTSTVQKIGARGQAVRLFYQDGLSVDVAAVVKNREGVYAIPDGSGGWLQTNPLQHDTYMNRRNAELGNNLKRFVVVLKQWNKAHSSRLSSFHLEMLAARTFSTLGSDRRKALRVFFDYNLYNLSVFDPAGFGGDLSSGLTSTTKQAINQSLTVARDRADLAIAAENRGDHAEAKRQWKMVLGAYFPTN